MMIHIIPQISQMKPSSRLVAELCVAPLYLNPAA